MPPACKLIFNYFESNTVQAAAHTIRSPELIMLSYTVDSLIQYPLI